VQLVFLLVILAVSGLALRWDWAPRVPSWLVASGAVLFVAGYAGAVWAVVANPFFSEVVRIQTDRGHTVVSTGPYRFVRHPGYAVRRVRPGFSTAAGVRSGRCSPGAPTSCSW
jgi:protein-S-isoprenylcysteine O-methyltransferase Ste14